jgi:hypothetical protein
MSAKNPIADAIDEQLAPAKRELASAEAEAEAAIRKRDTLRLRVDRLTRLREDAISALADATVTTHEATEPTVTTQLYRIVRAGFKTHADRIAAVLADATEPMSAPDIVKAIEAKFPEAGTQDVKIIQTNLGGHASTRGWLKRREPDGRVRYWAGKPHEEGTAVVNA